MDGKAINEVQVRVSLLGRVLSLHIFALSDMVSVTDVSRGLERLPQGASKCFQESLGAPKATLKGS